MRSGRPDDALAAAARALSSEGVAWSVLRDAAPEVARAGSVVELDVLVHPAHLARAESALATAGFVPRPAFGRAPHRFHVAPVGGAWAKVDLVTELSFGDRHQLVTDVAPALLSRSTADGIWRRLDPADHFAALALHALLDRAALRARDREALAATVGQAGDGGPLGALVDRVSAPDLGWQALVAAVAEHRWDDLARSSSQLRRLLAAQGRRRVTRRSLANRFGRRVVRPMAAVRRPGLTLALLGPDGSGKSAVAEAVVRASYGPGRVLYGGLHPRWSRRLRAPGATTAAKVVRLWGVGAAAAWHRRRGRLVVFDRHPVEGRRPPVRHLTTRARLRRRVLACVLPPPDAVVVLDAPAEVLASRKQENPFEQLVADRRSYLQLADTLPDATVVDASAGLDDVGRRISALAWDRSVGVPR